MADLALSSLFILGDVSIDFGDPVTVTNAWADRLAGTAFVEADPMTGVVIAISMEGPVVVGSCDIDAEGNWEIINIAERYADKELIVLGIPRDLTASVAIASRVKPV